ncbi:MAG: sigma-70 family RNA polymerase sigma factor [Candidatus Cloacimonetes bacterium]|nr:sigma-70 family RNA polymerase sigma factor [Candidatus Cloacimonadota bacterium]
MNQSFENFFPQIEKKISAYIRRQGFPLSDLEDLLQEIRLRVWQNWHKLNPELEVLPWVYTVARNERLRWLAKKGKNPSLVQDSLDELPIPQILEQREQSNTVKTAIQSLSESQREILVLKFYQNLSFEETAKVVGLPASTVKSQMYKILKELLGRLL